MATQQESQPVIGAPTTNTETGGGTRSSAASDMKSMLRGASYEEGAAMVAPRPEAVQLKPAAPSGGAAPAAPAATPTRKGEAKKWMRTSCAAEIESSRQGLKDSMRSHCESAAGQFAAAPIGERIPIEISTRDQWVGEAALPSEIADYLMLQPGDKALFDSNVCGSEPVYMEVLASQDASGGKLIVLRGYCNLNHDLMSSGGRLELEDWAVFNVTLNCGKGSQGGLMGAAQAALADPAATASAMVVAMFNPLD